MPQLKLDFQNPTFPKHISTALLVRQFPLICGLPRIPRRNKPIYALNSAKIRSQAEPQFPRAIRPQNAQHTRYPTD